MDSDKKDYLFMYLFFDTETTGLPKSWKAPVTDLKNWPRMVQLAWMLYEPDGTLIESHDHIIYPEGFAIPYDAARVHGISTERAKEEGLPLSDSLIQFAKAVDLSTHLIAHNMSFDEKIIGAEFLRKKVPHTLFDTIRLCTMHSSTDYCEIPGRYGYKWPKLEELHRILFGQAFEDAHNAKADVLACANCFFELKKLGVM